MKAQPEKVTVEGEGWSIEMTPEEYSAWVAYDESHPHLAATIPVEPLLRMFLANYRMGAFAKTNTVKD